MNVNEWFVHSESLMLVNVHGKLNAWLGEEDFKQHALLFNP